jgi:uncharacterized protein
MRKKSLIDALMSRTRQAVLSATLLRPERSWYLVELARHLGVRPSTIQRDLAALTDVGILTSRRQGQMVYYQADSRCPVYSDLRGLLSKTTGLVDVLRRALESVADRIVCCFVYGSIARGREESVSDLDLLIIGNVALSDIAAPLREAWDRVGREISPRLYRPSELAKRLAAHDHFLLSVLKKRKLFVIGTADDLEQVAGRQSRDAGGVK